MSTPNRTNRTPAAQDDLNKKTTTRRQGGGEADLERLNNLCSLLRLAFEAAVITNFNANPNLRIVVGDDMRVTATPSSDPKQAVTIATPGSLPTRRTIGLTAKAEALIQESAAYTLREKLVPIQVGLAGVASRYVQLLQKWAVPGELPDSVTCSDDVRNALDDLRASVRKWRVYIPLVNFVLHDIDRFDFGAIQIRRSEGVAREILDSVEPILRTSPRSDVEKEENIKQVRELLRFFEQIPSVVICNVESSQDGVIQQATADVTSNLCILRCVLSSAIDPNARAWVGIAGSTFSGKRLTVAVADNEENWNLSFATTGYSMPVNMTTQFIDYLRKNRFLDRASQLLRIDAARRTSLQNALMSGAQLLGNAVICDDDALSVTLSVSAIEVFLYGQASWRKRIKIMGRLLVTDGHRDTLERQMKAVLDLRNHLIHRGPVIFDSSFRFLAEALAGHVFLKLCEISESYNSMHELMMEIGG